MNDTIRQKFDILKESLTEQLKYRKKDQELIDTLKAENKKILDANEQLADSANVFANDLNRVETENEKLREEIQTVAKCGFTPDGEPVSLNVITWLEYLMEKGV